MALPRLIPMILRVERAVGRRLEDAVATGRLTDPLLHAARVTRGARAAVDHVRAGTVHALYLPTDRDVRQLAMAIARLQSELHELSARVEEQERTVP
jgi:hypothetical protein